jgi:hypothetical protein
MALDGRVACKPEDAEGVDMSVDTATAGACATVDIRKNVVGAERFLSVVAIDRDRGWLPTRRAVTTRFAGLSLGSVRGPLRRRQFMRAFVG